MTARVSPVLIQSPVPDGCVRQALTEDVALHTNSLGFVIGAAGERRTFLPGYLNPDRFIVATGPDGDLIGYIGFVMDGTGPFTFGPRDLGARYGLVSGLIRNGVFHLVMGKGRRDSLYVALFMVDAAHRRGGVGSALIAEAERIARVGGKARVNLYVNASNEAGLAFYRRSGFEEGRALRLPFLARIAAYDEVIPMAKRLG